MNQDLDDRAASDRGSPTNSNRNSDEDKHNQNYKALITFTHLKSDHLINQYANHGQDGEQQQIPMILERLDVTKQAKLLASSEKALLPQAKSPLPQQLPSREEVRNENTAILQMANAEDFNDSICDKW